MTAEEEGGEWDRERDAVSYAAKVEIGDVDAAVPFGIEHVFWGEDGVASIVQFFTWSFCCTIDDEGAAIEGVGDFLPRVGNVIDVAFFAIAAVDTEGVVEDCDEG